MTLHIRCQCSSCLFFHHYFNKQAVVCMAAGIENAVTEYYVRNTGATLNHRWRRRCFIHRTR